jgi:hypothetical protein
MARKRNLCSKALVIGCNLTALLTLSVALTTGGWITIQEPLNMEELLSPQDALEDFTAPPDVEEFSLSETEGEVQGVGSKEAPDTCVAVSDAGLWSLCVRMVCFPQTNYSSLTEDLKGELKIWWLC